MIRQTKQADFEKILNIINDAAIAYKGIIPPDRWKEPYMSENELANQIEEGVEFTGFYINDELIGVMGIQDRVQVNLIRHAYVRTIKRKSGIGSKLIQHLLSITDKPVLIGTWSAAMWAISFYQKHGFKLVSEEEKNRLLRRYWSIPERQVETSIVLANSK